MEFHFRKSSNDYLQDSFYHEMITIGSLSHPIITFCSLNHWWSQSEFLIIWWLQSIVLIPIISLFITSLLNRNQWSLSSDDLITIYTPDHLFLWQLNNDSQLSPIYDKETYFPREFLRKSKVIYYEPLQWSQYSLYHLMITMWSFHHLTITLQRLHYPQKFIPKICTKFCTKNLYKT